MQTTSETSRSAQAARQAVGEGGHDQERDAKPGGINRK
jgi:hypothetical protein